MDLVVALAGTIIGVGLLFGSWTRRLRPRKLVMPAGWAILSLSAVVWIRFGGPEFGIAWGLIAVALIAWSFAALGREQRRPDERRPQAHAAGKRPDRRAVGLTLARILVVAVLTGVASILFSVAATTYLPWDAGNRYVLAALAAPVVWGGVAVWTATTTRLPRAAGVLVGVSAACALLLFLGRA